MWLHMLQYDTNKSQGKFVAVSLNSSFSSIHSMLLRLLLHCIKHHIYTHKQCTGQLDHSYLVLLLHHFVILPHTQSHYYFQHHSFFMSSTMRSLLPKVALYPSHILLHNNIIVRTYMVPIDQLVMMFFEQRGLMELHYAIVQHFDQDEQ